MELTACWSAGLQTLSIAWMNHRILNQPLWMDVDGMICKWLDSHWIQTSADLNLWSILRQKSTLMLIRYKPVIPSGEKYTEVQTFQMKSVKCCQMLNADCLHWMEEGRGDVKSQKKSLLASIMLHKYFLSQLIPFTSFWTNKYKIIFFLRHTVNWIKSKYIFTNTELTKSSFFKFVYFSPYLNRSVASSSGINKYVSVSFFHELIINENWRCKRT